VDSKKLINRLPEEYAFDPDLVARHMVFLAGPRQTGKTRLAKEWLEKSACTSLYFNWDDALTRRRYANDPRFFESAARAVNMSDPWLVFDEIHKRKNWRDILKGAYDLFSDDFRFLITGSTRLDFFRKSGDSLVGRYNLFHLFPLNIRELTDQKLIGSFIIDGDFEQINDTFSQLIGNEISAEVGDAWQIMQQFGPFPEPLLRQKERFCRKWHTEYFQCRLGLKR